MDSDATAIVLFDGVCNFCNASVNFIIDHDPSGRFRFAALQSERGLSLQREHGRTPTDEPESIVLIDSGRFYDRSTAALRIARHLRGGWKVLYAFILVPRPLRDFVYRFIARHRYGWFGRTDACRVPTADVRARFLT